MSERLWPKTPATTAGGPTDMLYYALSPEQIQLVLKFYHARKVKIPAMRDVWDCDDLATEFSYLARVWSAQSFYGMPAVPAVGIVVAHVDGFYELDEPPSPWFGAHALIAILRNDGAWLFFEPMTGKLLPIEGPIYEGVIQVLKVSI